MKRSIILLAICNLFFLLCFLYYVLPFNDFFMAFLINVLILIAPGLGWIGFLKNRIKDTVALSFLTVFLSTIIFVLLTAVYRLLNIAPGPLSYLISTTVLTNVGLLLSNPLFVLGAGYFNKTKMTAIAACVLLIYGFIYWGMKSVPHFRDLDGEHQGTAYGLMHELKPYLTSDIVVSPFYFAHPPLTNFYNACSILFFDKLNDYRYFFDSAKNTERVLKTNPGEALSIKTGDRLYRIVNLDNGFFGREMEGEEELPWNVLPRKKIVRFIYDQDRSQFERNPQVFPARASNIFASIFIFGIFFVMINTLTHSPFLGLLGGLIYVLSPGMFVRSCVSEHLAFTNCILLLLSYQYIFPERFTIRKGPWKFLSLAPGIMAAFINQKIIILIFAVFMVNLIRFCKNNEKNKSIRELFLNDPIINGYFLGTLLFWAYGFLIDKQAFIASHIHAHFFDRIIHLNSMFPEDYPSVFALWREFNIEFPFLVLSVLAVICSFRKFFNSRMSVFPVWILCGAFIFSIVDWKQTNHLMCIVPPLIIALMVFISAQKRVYRNILIAGIILCLGYSFWFDVSLMNNFAMYIPTSGW